MCVDFTILKKNIIRPRFDTATSFQAVWTIPPGMKFFTVIDVLKGYHQVQLDEESLALTTSFTRLSLISDISGSDATVLDPVLERIKMGSDRAEGNDH